MSVIQLDERRKPKPVKAPVFTGNGYFCTQCDSDVFRIFDSGRVHCSKCGAQMNNLFISKWP